MMIKYRVHEVAKDLNIPNKDVIDTLQKYTGETKKHMTALTEEELDLVFEAFTQKNASENLDDYFAQRKTEEEPLIEEEKPDVNVEVAEKPAAAKAAKPAAQPAAQPVSYTHLYPCAALTSVKYELMSGSLLFCGVFMVTDPVTSPRTMLGRAIYGAFAGLLVMGFRLSLIHI